MSNSHRMLFIIMLAGCSSNATEPTSLTDAAPVASPPISASVVGGHGISALGTTDVGGASSGRCMDLQVVENSAPSKGTTVFVARLACGSDVSETIVYTPIPTKDFTHEGQGGTWALHTAIPGYGRIDVNFHNNGQWTHYRYRSEDPESWGHSFYQQNDALEGTILGVPVGSDIHQSFLHMGESHTRTD